MFVIQQVAPSRIPARRLSPGYVATAADFVAAAIDDAIIHGLFLADSNPNLFGLHGAQAWSTDIEDALTFATREEAFACWQAQSETLPKRPDGKPNRPLTAYSVSIYPI